MILHYRNKPGRWRPSWNAGPGELDKLDGYQAQRAWRCWREQRMDTCEIATLLNVPEHTVFNTLRHLRELERNQFGSASPPSRAESGRASNQPCAPVTVGPAAPNSAEAK